MNGQPKFITSVVSENKFFVDGRPIIAVSGKSNVGKSSIINMLAGNKKLARTSVTPGRTRMINYFDFGEFVLADLPGYGYAKVSKEEKAKWANLMESFFRTQKITLLIALFDSRHLPTTEDKDMVRFLYAYAIPFIAVATKVDKLPKTRIKPQMKDIAAELKIGVGDVLPTSAEKNIGKAELLKEISKAVSLAGER